MESPRPYHFHLVSDASGETIRAVARAALVQFGDVPKVEHHWSLVRTRRQLAEVVDGLRDHPGMVLFTLVDPGIRDALQGECRRLRIPCVSVLDPVIAALAKHLGRESTGLPGRQHRLDAEYFGRIEAMDFAIALDDGRGARELDSADVILVGVSRTSKTPTCIYLANQGIKAANVPYVPDVPLPAELDRVRHALVVGLTKDPTRLVQIRRSRMRMLKQEAETDYINPERVTREVRDAQRHYAARGWPVIDVTRRSIEETAAAIMGLLEHRRGVRAGATE
jgi:hypothetical protein